MAGRRLTWLVVVAAVLLGGRTASPDDHDSDYQVIVHPDNAVTDVARDVLREAYLKKAIEWPGGETIRPIDLTTRFTQRERFAHEVLRKTPAQLKSYWNQQIFSGKGVPPPEASSPGDVVNYVVAHRGAVGYIPARADPGHAKVVRIH